MSRLCTVLLGAGTMVLALSACTYRSPESNQNQFYAPAPATGGPVQVTTGATPALVVKETNGFQFAPITATVKVGDVVEWVDTDGTTPYNVTIDGGVASPTMTSGDKFQARFSAPGTYHYVGTCHAPGMEGTVTVGS